MVGAQCAHSCLVIQGMLKDKMAGIESLMILIFDTEEGCTNIQTCLSIFCFGFCFVH